MTSNFELFWYWVGKLLLQALLLGAAYVAGAVRESRRRSREVSTAAEPQIEIIRTPPPFVPVGRRWNGTGNRSW